MAPVTFSAALKAGEGAFSPGLSTVAPVEVEEGALAPVLFTVALFEVVEGGAAPEAEGGAVVFAIVPKAEEVPAAVPFTVATPGTAGRLALAPGGRVAAFAVLFAELVAALQITLAFKIAKCRNRTKGHQCHRDHLSIVLRRFLPSSWRRVLVHRMDVWMGP